MNKQHQHQNTQNASVGSENSSVGSGTNKCVLYIAKFMISHLVYYYYCVSYQTNSNLFMLGA